MRAAESNNSSGKKKISCVHQLRGEPPSGELIIGALVSFLPVESCDAINSVASSSMEIEELHIPCSSEIAKTPSIIQIEELQTPCSSKNAKLQPASTIQIEELQIPSRSKERNTSTSLEIEELWVSKPKCTTYEITEYDPPVKKPLTSHQIVEVGVTQPCKNGNKVETKKVEPKGGGKKKVKRVKSKQSKGKSKKK